MELLSCLLLTRYRTHASWLTVCIPHIGLSWWMLAHACAKTLFPLLAGDAKVLEGHAFVVEAAVSRGGRDLKPGINVYRFANRIPLLFEVHPCGQPRLLTMHLTPQASIQRPCNRAADLLVCP